MGALEKPTACQDHNNSYDFIESITSQASTVALRKHVNFNPRGCLLQNFLLLHIYIGIQTLYSVCSAMHGVSRSRAIGREVKIKE